MKKRYLVLALLVLIALALPLLAHTEIIDSGYCGGEDDEKNLTWKLDDNGLLTISGTGAMKNYYFNRPWNIAPKQVVIKSGVTSIGDYAFVDCTDLKSVTIPNSVTSIGGSAFKDCSNLTSVTIPNSVTSIGYRAFEDCTGLKSVTIPNSVTSIGDCAFGDCSSLTSVTIGNSITSISESAFSGCSSLTSVTIPNSVTSIGYGAFSGCSSLTSVTIPNSVTSIGYYAFTSCSSLTSVTIPNSVTTIGNWAFRDCSSLRSVTIPNSVTSIGYYAFKNCSNLKSINVSSGNNQYCSVNGVLYNKAKTELIQFPGGFNGSFTIPSSVTIIGDSAFYNCSGLASVTIPNSVTRIGNYAFEYCSCLKSVTIPNSVTYIAPESFQYCSSLTSVTIPNSVTYIGYWAFRYCSSLKSVTILNSDTSIYRDAFANCSSDLTIFCYTESTAYEYAKANNIKVKLLDGKPTITKQPVSVTVNEGSKATFKVTADNADSFRWYYRTSSTGTWTKVSKNGTSATYTLTTKAKHNGYQFYCRVKNTAGYMKSKAVTLTVVPKPTITTQPSNKKVNEGAKATFKVMATNADTYQWYYRKSSKGSWTAVSKNGTSAKYTLSTKAKHNGYQFYCKVTNTAGSVDSEAVTLTVKPKPVITAQPASQSVKAGAKATFKVVASNADTYQWYYLKPGGTDWTAVSKNGTSASYTLTTATKHNGYKFKCVVKNTVGSVKSNVVTLKVK